MVRVYLFMALLLFGCSSAPTIIEREIEVPVLVPAVHDTIMLKDTVIVKDSLWYGEVQDSLGRVIGDLKVFFKRKIAELKLNEKKDTIRVPVIDTVNVPANSISTVLDTGFNWWEKGVLYLMLILTSGIIVYLKLKRGKVV